MVIPLRHIPEERIQKDVIIVELTVPNGDLLMANTTAITKNEASSLNPDPGVCASTTDYGC